MSSTKYILGLFADPDELLIFVEKKKKEQELQQSLERLDKVLREMVVPLEF